VTLAVTLFFGLALVDEVLRELSLVLGEDFAEVTIIVVAAVSFPPIVSSLLLHFHPAPTENPR